MIEHDVYIVRDLQPKDPFGISGDMFGAQPVVEVDVHCAVDGKAMPHTIHFTRKGIQMLDTTPGRLQFNIWLQSRLYIWRQLCRGK